MRGVRGGWDEGCERWAGWVVWLENCFNVMFCFGY